MVMSVFLRDNRDHVGRLPLKISAQTISAVRIIISTHRLKKDGFTTPTLVKIDKKKQTKQNKHAHTHAHVETFVKADFAHIPLTAKEL